MHSQIQNLFEIKAKTGTTKNRRFPLLSLLLHATQKQSFVFDELVPANKREEPEDEKKKPNSNDSTSHWVKGVKWAALRCYTHKNDVSCFYLDTPFYYDVLESNNRGQSTIKISLKCISFMFIHRPAECRRPKSNWIINNKNSEKCQTTDSPK